jgi:hypothetical protein
MSDRISPLHMYPYLRRLLPGWIGNQVEGVPGMQSFQVPVPARKYGPVHGGSELTRMTVREPRKPSCHNSGLIHREKSISFDSPLT